MIFSGMDALNEFYLALREYDFLRQALWINLMTGTVTAPLGVFLVLRRMSLMGDALSHALLPGVAMSYFFFGLSVPAMTLGGFCAGTLVVLFTVWAQEHSPLKEDSHFAAFYLLSLSIGVLTISIRGNSVDLLHILFGSPLLATTESLRMTLLVCIVVGALFVLFRRFFLLEIFDPIYLSSRGYKPQAFQTFFLILVVASLVVSFQTNGTLLAMGQLILPGIIGRLWSRRLGVISFIAILNSCLGSIVGLFLSYQFDWPLGPTTLLFWGVIYCASLVLNPDHGLLKRIIHQKHYGH